MQLTEILASEDAVDDYKPVFPDEYEDNLSTDSSINRKLDAANETPGGGGALHGGQLPLNLKRARVSVKCIF